MIEQYIKNTFYSPSGCVDHRNLLYKHPANSENIRYIGNCAFFAPAPNSLRIVCSVIHQDYLYQFEAELRARQDKKTTKLLSFNSLKFVYPFPSSQWCV
jgi:hypothetical protein